MEIQKILQKYWGYSQFRPLQSEIINAALEGNDVLALLPTGGGKSLCFQLPAMVKEGICVVITPLIALMKDQVANLKAKNIAAQAVFSGMSKREVDIALDNCIYGNIKFLYLSPERLMQELVQVRLQHMNINYFVVDEAHCISQWGYDFRPAYLQISNLREWHVDVPFIALTATAVDRVIQDIQEQLHFRSGKNKVFTGSFNRENLAYLVLKEEEKENRILKIIRKVNGSGIIYVRNRKRTREVAQFLTANGFSAAHYNAGLSSEERAANQESWKNNEIQVMVATNAFGMGIDKPDVRFVIHMDIPDSLEAYYQEAGRAGRDGKKAYAVLLYQEFDVQRLKDNLLQHFPSPKEVAQIYFQLGNYYQLAYGAGQFLNLEFDLADFSHRYQVFPRKVMHALQFLARDKWLSITENTTLPSRIQMDVTPPEVYSFQVENRQYDSFIKLLLRTYTGLFQQFVEVDEHSLARKLGVPVGEIQKALSLLDQYKLLTYLPRTDKPRIIFLQPRVDTQNLQIDNAFLFQRRQVMETHLQSVLDYLKDSECRNTALLNYFGENTSTDCGKCDLCLKRIAEESRFLRMKEAVLEFLAEKRYTKDEIEQHFGESTKIHLQQALLELAEEGKIKKGVNGEYERFKN